MAEKFTFRELKAKLETLSEEQLNQEIIWHGDERGGKINSLSILEEDYYRDDEGACWPESQADTDEMKFAFSAGTVVLDSDY